MKYIWWYCLVCKWHEVFFTRMLWSSILFLTSGKRCLETSLHSTKVALASQKWSETVICLLSNDLSLPFLKGSTSCQCIELCNFTRSFWSGPRPPFPFLESDFGISIWFPDDLTYLYSIGKRSSFSLGPRIARIQIVWFHYSVINFLVPKYSMLQVKLRDSSQ